jgi:CheY-like chemotaxis protein
VVDSGIGIPEEIRKQIFEPFFTSKKDGKGLGLSVVYGITTRHGGKVEIDSEVGSGSTFTVSFPAISAPQRETSRSIPRKTGSSVRILLVEDNAQNRQLFEVILTGQGHQVTAVDSGKEALKLFGQEKFDLVVTDLSMQGLSGWEVAEGVKKMAPKIPVILLSGWGIQQQHEEVKKRGIDLVLNKPCTVTELASAVAQVLQDQAPS